MARSDFPGAVESIPRSRGRGHDLTPPAAVVIAADNPTGLQTARILDSYGIPVVGIARNRAHPCVRTRALKHTITADIDGPELIETLLGDVQALVSGDAVLIPCHDLSVVTLARHRDDLFRHGFRFVIPDSDLIETLLYKDSFFRFARMHDFPVPETRIVREAEEIPSIEMDFTFPCILKPSVKTRAWQREARGKAIRIETPDELRRLLPRLKGLAPALVIQEWVAGGDEHHFTCNCYFDRDGGLQATVTTQKLRQWPPQVGQGCLSVARWNDTVRDLTIQLFTRAQHRGLGYLEVKQDARTGRYVILEANVGRPTGRSATAEAVGVNLLRTVYLDALERPLPPAGYQSRREVKWVHARRDLQASFGQWKDGHLGLSQWSSSLRGPRVHALFSWTDPLPFLTDIARSAKKLVDRRPGGGRPEPSSAPSPLPSSASEALPPPEGRRPHALSSSDAGAASIFALRPAPSSTTPQGVPLRETFSPGWSPSVCLAP